MYHPDLKMPSTQEGRTQTARVARCVAVPVILFFVINSAFFGGEVPDAETLENGVEENYELASRYGGLAQMP